MANFIILAGTALVLFASASAFLSVYPATPSDLDGSRNLDDRARRLRIPVADEGDSLDGWMISGTGPGVVLFFHGYGRTHDRGWRYADFLQKSGYSLVAVDFRSSRREDRKPTTLGYYELEDAKAVLAWVGRQRGLKGQKIGLIGESLGGAVGIVLASEDPKIAAAVVDCPFATSARGLDDYSQRLLHLPRWPFTPIARALGKAVTGHDPGTFDALSAAKKLSERPVLFIASERDERVSPDQVRDLWRAAGSKDPLWIIPEARHNQGWEIEGSDYEAKVRAFFDRHLRGKGAGVPAGETKT